MKYRIMFILIVIIACSSTSNKKHEELKEIIEININQVSNFSFKDHEKNDFKVGIHNFFDSTYIFTSSDTSIYYPRAITYKTREGERYGGLIDYTGTLLYKMKMREQRNFFFSLDNIYKHSDTVIFHFGFFTDTLDFTKIKSIDLTYFIEKDTMVKVNQRIY